MYQRRYNNDMLHVMVSLQGFLETRSLFTDFGHMRTRPDTKRSD